MDLSKQSPSNIVKKQEDIPSLSIKSERDIKPVRALNRVPRACNACRKQKMRCEGADNPPCRRCRNSGIQCQFEKPSREPTLTGEAGLERFKTLENRVVEIHNMVGDILSILQSQKPLSNTFSSFSGASHASPSYSDPSPSLSAATAASTMMDTSQQHSPVDSYNRSISTSMSKNSSYRQQAQNTRPASQSPQGKDVGSLQAIHDTPFLPSTQTYVGPGRQGLTLPRILTLQESNASRPGPSNVSSMRYRPNDEPVQPPFHAQSDNRLPPLAGGHASMQSNIPGSNITSSSTSDVDDDDNGELPKSGLLAPWEVLRGLADVAVKRAAQENAVYSEPNSRARSASPDEMQKKPQKRMRMMRGGASHRLPDIVDVVTNNTVSETEARDLFNIFYKGCSTFLPIFDARYDTYDTLRQRSPFAFNCICMVAAKVRDGGGRPSETYLECLKQVQAASCSSLFSPVSRQEDVQAMILVSGWSDNGWLSGGHAVRMATELSMHKVWPKLRRRILSNKASNSPEDYKLVTASRTWFCLYLFEHQMSYGTGRPAILKDDDSIAEARRIINHPLRVADDIRLCSTLELMAIRERIHNKLSLDPAINDETFSTLKKADQEFEEWLKEWDETFNSFNYDGAAFYRQSLLIQMHMARLFHYATALRNIDGPEDILGMPAAQKDLALATFDEARRALHICVEYEAYRESLKYAVHYTHATATFAASLLLRLARLFPECCDIHQLRGQVQKLVDILAKVSAVRYAKTLQFMLDKSQRRIGVPSRETNREFLSPVTTSRYTHEPDQERYTQQNSVSMSTSFQNNAHLDFEPAINPYYGDYEGNNYNGDYMPLWQSDQSFGGANFLQNGFEAFMMPPGTTWNQHNNYTYSTS